MSRTICRHTLAGMQVKQVSAPAALSTLAKLYGGSEADLAHVVNVLSPLWLALDDAGKPLGAIGLRPRTVNGAEVLGGALNGEKDVALALLQGAKQAEPRLSAYAEPHLLPARALREAGFVPASAYVKFTGPLPTALPAVPDGYRLVPLSEVISLETRRFAQESYADQLGHTPTTDEVIQPDAGGSNDALGWLAFDDAGNPVGVIRVWRDEDTISMSTPGVQPMHRNSGIRKALILAACQSAQRVGVKHLILESWGETGIQHREDQELGLTIEEMTPIYALPNDAH